MSRFVVVDKLRFYGYTIGLLLTGIIVGTASGLMITGQLLLGVTFGILGVSAMISVDRKYPEMRRIFDDVSENYENYHSSKTG